MHATTQDLNAHTCKVENNQQYHTRTHTNEFLFHQNGCYKIQNYDIYRLTLPPPKLQPKLQSIPQLNQITNQ